jgi:large subunit ribosomal protein L16
MLQPTRTKFRKAFKGRIHGVATSGTTLAFGQYGLKALEPERVTARQIEAARRALTRFMKRSGRVWIRVFPDVPVSKKPIEGAWAKAKVPRALGRARKPGRTCLKSTVFPSKLAKRWDLPRQAARQDRFINVSPSDAMKSADVRAMTLDQLDDEVLKLKRAV